MKILIICLIPMLIYATSGCQKEDIQSPEPDRQTPAGTWILTKAGRWLSDDVKHTWNWDSISPSQAFTVTFSNEHRFSSQEQIPSLIGSYADFAGQLEVRTHKTVAGNESISPKMIGSLENNRIILKFLVGSIDSAGYQFKFYKKN